MAITKLSEIPNLEALRGRLSSCKDATEIARHISSHVRHNSSQPESPLVTQLHSPNANNTTSSAGTGLQGFSKLLNGNQYIQSLISAPSSSGTVNSSSTTTQ